MGSGVHCSSSPAVGRMPVCRGLNLTLELKDRTKMPDLLAAIAAAQPKTDLALRELHFVHFARFLPTRDFSALLVITEFDGDLEPYVMDFALAIGDVFTTILSYIREAPARPVREDPEAFWAFIQKNNRVLGREDYPLFSAYPDKTVLEILGQRQGLPPPVTEPAASAVVFDDVQGNILRPYRAGFARHFALVVRSARAARQLLGDMVSGDAARAPQITAEQQAGRGPDHLINIGFTAAGLEALGVAQADLDAFPDAFLQGPADATRARDNGDSGDSAPAYWSLGGPGSPVHVLVSLYVVKGRPQLLDELSAQLGQCWRDGGVVEVFRQDAAALPDKKVHFGYREGMAEPRLAGVDDPAQGADMQPRASVGEFLLGKDYVDVFGGPSLGRLSAGLCENATFAAVRLLEQDVEGFETLLDEASRQHGLDRELIAAKMMGRWRDGTPLSRQPSLPAGGAAPSEGSDFNAFDYAPSAEHPLTHDDHDGARCPIGSHIRRMNPRSAMGAGRPHSRRVIRRGMPFGPAWTGDGTDEKVSRGLFGLFLCGDIERQFEFLMKIWANGDISAPGIRGTQDPIIGQQDLGGGFRFPVDGGPETVHLEVRRLVRTLGSLYLLMPGLDGVRHLAAGSGGVEAASLAKPGDSLATLSAGTFRLEDFDPTWPAFLSDPYPFYARFRAEGRPVHHVQSHGHDSFWVFSHELVTQVCSDSDNFLKRPATVGREAAPQGLFFMDPPRHPVVRPVMDGLFAEAIRDVQDIAVREAREALRDIRARFDGGGAFDLVAHYANRVPRHVFLAVMGVPRAEWTWVGAQATTVMVCSDQNLGPRQRKRGEAAAASLAARLAALGSGSGCPMHSGPQSLLGLMREQGLGQGMTGEEVALTALHLAMGGFLSTEFLLTTGVWNLLRGDGAPMAQLRAEPDLLGSAIEEMSRFDAPFQTADRYAARALELGGLSIPKDARVTAFYGAANRDPQRFSAPDTFDIRRTPGPFNYALGHGAHRCIGEPLMKQVVPVALRELLAAFPGLSLVNPGVAMPEVQTNPYFRTFPRLLVRT